MDIFTLGHGLCCGTGTDVQQHHSDGPPGHTLPGQVVGACTPPQGIRGQVPGLEARAQGGDVVHHLSPVLLYILHQGTSLPEVFTGVVHHHNDSTP